MAFGLSAGAVAAIGTVGGALISADAADNAADAQKDAANRTNATNIATNARQERLQEPFRNSGVAANNRLMQLLGIDMGYDQDVYDQIFRDMRNESSAGHAAKYGFGFDGAPSWAAGGIAEFERGLRDEAMQKAKEQYKANPTAKSGDFGSLLKKFGVEDFEADPGYAFRREEGMRGVEGGAAARGGLLSGAALKAIQKYGQGLASQEYGNAYSRFTNDQTNQYNKLAGIVNSGQGATNQISNTAGQFAQNNASALGAYGNAQAAGYIGQANALNNGLGQGVNYYQNQQIIDKLRNPGNSGSSSNGLMDWYY